MRNRVAALAAITAFVVGLASVAVLAARSGGDGLEALPSLARGREAAGMDAMASRATLAPEAVEYEIAKALPDLPPKAPAYRLRSSASRSAVERVARALGITAPLVEEDGRMRAGNLTVDDAPGMPWYLSDLAPGCKEAPVSSDGRSVSVQGCAVSTASATASQSGAGSPPSCPPDADCGSSSSPASPTPLAPVPDSARPMPMPEPMPLPHPEPMPPPTPVADLPTKAEAERIARDAFTAMGVGVDGLRLDGGYSSWEAMVSPRVGGLEVLGLLHSLSIGPKGKVQAASGYLGAADRIGDYPLVGVETAFDRLRVGSDTDDPTPLVVRSDITPRRVVITDVRLALQHIDDALVPVYLFVADDGGTRPVPGVPEKYLEEPRAYDPGQGRPEPGPLETGGGMCTGAATGSADMRAEQKNAPLTVSVCVEPAVAKVGQEVVFQVVALDPDAPISSGGCGGPNAAFGDEEQAVTVSCMPACAAPRTKPAPEPGKYSETFRHTYQRAGTYTARFTVQSAVCNPYGSTGTGEVTVRVG
ncbi:MAG TPA: PKD domain-containing protein [Acidimicrobiales bacterium]|jgi:hypothetical protein